MVSLTRKIAEGTALITLANIISAVFNLLSFIFIVRILDRFEYGLLVLALSAISIASSFLDFGIGGVITADLSRERKSKRFDRAKSLLYRYSQFEVIVGFLFFIIIFFSNTYFEQRYSETVAKLIRISAFLIITNALKKIFLTTFNSHLDFKSIFSLNIEESFFKFIYIILFGYYLELGIYGVMLAYLASSITALLLNLPSYFGIIKDYISVTRSKECFFLKTITSHGKWVISIRPVKQLGDNLPPWIIQFFLGVEAVAVFNVAIRVTAYVISLLSPLESVLMPIVSQEIRNIEKLNKIINKSIKYSIWFSIPIITFSLIFSPFAFNSLFGNSYIESTRIFQILIFISLLYALNLVMRPLFFGFKVQKYLFIVYVINIVILSLFGTILTLLAGLYGMALTFIIRGFVAFLLRYRYIKIIGIRIEFREMTRIDEYDKELLKKIKRKIRKYMNKLSRSNI